MANFNWVYYECTNKTLYVGYMFFTLIRLLCQ